MRFEIKSGGIFAILLGIGVLSGAVFALGLLAGYDVGRESQVSSEQVATSYPLAPSASEASPAATPSEAGGAEAPSPEAAASAEPGIGASPSAPAAAASAPTTEMAHTMPSPSAHRTSPSRTAAAEVPPPAEASVPPEESPDTGGAAPEEAGTPAPREHTASTGNGASSAAATAPRYRRRPYNIQIEAAMDRNGADSMVQRLQRLGYSPHLVPTVIAGQTWYKVEVGPYATQDEAAAAQEQLRQKYNSAYAGGGDTSKPAGASGGNDTSGTVANPSD